MLMKNEAEKKGFFSRLFGSQKPKNSCCCDLQIEEVTEKDTDNKGSEKLADSPKDSCCK